MLGRVASFGGGMASSLGRLMPKSPQKNAARQDSAASAPARQAGAKVCHSDITCQSHCCHEAETLSSPRHPADVIAAMCKPSEMTGTSATIVVCKDS